MKAFFVLFALAFASPALASEAAQAKVNVPDVQLVDQLGRAKRLKSEVIRDRIVVVDFVFTSCTTICPVLSGVLGTLQDALGPRAGTDVQLVSVSIDPAFDTPTRLKEYADRHRAGPGWTWLTGPTDDVNRVLKAMGAWAPAVTGHAPFVLVGDGRTGKWLRFNGFPAKAELVAAIDRLAAARPKERK